MSCPASGPCIQRALRIFAFLLLFVCVSAFADEFLVGPSDYRSVITKAVPGSIMKLSPGVYNGGLQIVRLNGTADKPIVIEAADAAHLPRFLARPGKNTISIVDASYIVIRNLILDGRNLPVDGVKAEGYSRYAHHITLEGLQILRHGFSQDNVAISTKCPAWNWVIRGNTIARAGTGMYLGNSDGSAAFFAGLIEGNLIYDSIGYNLQIKHQQVRPAVADLPSDSHLTIIRHNVFSKFGNASTGHRARPNVLIGHFPKQGLGADDRYALYGNFFYANSTEWLFQAEGNVALYANLFVNPLGHAVHIQPHNDAPKNIWLFHNTIVANGKGIELEGDVDTYLRLMAGNAVFATSSGPARLQSENFVVPFSKAQEYLIDPSAPLGRLDLRFKPVVSRIEPSACTVSEHFPDAGKDFDGVAYRQCGVGAYATEAAVARWLPNLSIKPLRQAQDNF